MQVSDNQIREMIKNVKDPNLRAQYEATLLGATHSLVCETADGPVVIGERNVLGAWVDVSRAVDGKRPKHGLRSSRERLDGHMGFSCRCGNYSIKSEAEEGVITGAAPSREDLRIILERQSEAPTKAEVAKDGTITVDGFSIKPLGVGA